MELTVTIARALVLFGSGITLLLGIEQITGRTERILSTYLLFVVSLFVTVILYNFVLLSTDIPIRHPWCVFLFVTSVYVIGPLNYLYYYSLMYPGWRMASSRLFHFMPALCVLILETVVLSQPSSARSGILTRIYYGGDFHFMIAVLFAGGAIFFVYQLFLLRECISLRNEKSVRNGIRLVIVLETINILTPLPVALWMVIRWNELFLVSGLMTTSVLITIFLTNNRFPRFFMLMKKELIRRRYERSFLRGMDMELVGLRLEELMLHERVFSDFDLNLQSLAGMMGLTPHQLSQYLNEKLRTGFNAYVNRFRVEEAMRLLEEEPEMSVITVCFNVGFSSKSSFNSVFKGVTGMPPSAYRERHAGRTGPVRGKHGADL